MRDTSDAINLICCGIFKFWCRILIDKLYIPLFENFRICWATIGYEAPIEISGSHIYFLSFAEESAGVRKGGSTP